MHGKRAGYLFGSITNLAVEGFMGWRLGLVMYAIFIGAFHSVVEAAISQAVATIAVGGFGFYVAQFRSISLEARINEIRNLQQEDEKAKKKMIAGVKRTMRVMVAAIIAVDVVGAVYIGVTSAQADGLIGHAVAGSLLLAILSIIPFCAGGFIQAVAKLIPQEERQRVMERLFYNNLETMDNAVARYGKKARKLDPEIVLAEGWAGLEAAAAALDAQEGHQGLFADSVAQMRALQQPIRERESGKPPQATVTPAPMQPREKDWITAEHQAVEIMGYPEQPRLPEHAGITDESAGAAAVPFGNMALPVMSSASQSLSSNGHSPQHQPPPDDECE